MNNINNKYSNIVKWFEENNPNAESELLYNNPYELLVAVILSAQCTDKRVNIVTRELFKNYPTPKSLSEASTEQIFNIIRSISYPNNKAKHLFGMAKMLVDEFNSKVPDNREELMRLPGVGRKTANVITSVIFDQPNMAVDTHVFRVSERLGLTKGSKSPLETEKILISNIPTEKIARAHHWLILHGRYICLARKPKCEECGISQWCNYHLQ